MSGLTEAQERDERVKQMLATLAHEHRVALERVLFALEDFSISDNEAIAQARVIVREALGLPGIEEAARA